MFKITIVGKKKGKPTIKWMGVALAYVGIVIVIFLTCLTAHALSKASLGYSLFTMNGWVTLGVILAILVPTTLLGIGVRRALKTPPEKLNTLD